MHRKLRRLETRLERTGPIRRCQISAREQNVHIAINDGLNNNLQIPRHHFFFPSNLISRLSISALPAACIIINRFKKVHNILPLFT